jgi:hypothetical protein
MKTLTGIALAAVTAGVVFSTPAAAQVRSEIELTRQQIQTERQALVTAGMELTDEQAKAFWPVYREYRAELAPIGDRQVELIMGYADKYGSVDDDYAQKMQTRGVAEVRPQVPRRASGSEGGAVLPAREQARRCRSFRPRGVDPGAAVAYPCGGARRGSRIDAPPRRYPPAKLMTPSGPTTSRASRYFAPSPLRSLALLQYQ